VAVWALFKTANRKTRRNYKFRYSCFFCTEEHGKSKEFESNNQLQNHTNQCHSTHSDFKTMKRIIRNLGYAVSLGVVKN